MSSNQPLRAAIVGCGNIATTYAKQIQHYPEIKVVGFSDVAVDRAEKLAAEFGGRVFATLDDVLDDPSVDIVINLTIHHAHAEINRRVLRAGKHVHTEKPLALSIEEARELVGLAESNGVRLSTAPTTYLGEALQTAIQKIRRGACGTIRLVYAEVNHGRIESWHPNPEPFYEVGPLWDVGIYPVTAITAALGPVRQVRASAHVLFANRVTNEGRPFTLTTPDYYLAELTLASGAICRLTANFYVKASAQGGSIEFHGDLGEMVVGNFQQFNAAVQFAPFGQPLEAIPYVRTAFDGVEFGRGVQELAQALLEDRPHRASAAHGAHVIEILCAIESAVKSGGTVEVASDFALPAPMPWAA